VSNTSGTAEDAGGYRAKDRSLDQLIEDFDPG
jgi:hypothetical protein